MCSRPLPAVILALALAPAASAGDRAWTGDDILALKLVTDPNVSPDGRSVAYVVESLNPEKDAYQTDVWLVPTTGGDARPLASSPASDDFPRFSPDGRFVAFLSERPRPGAKEDDEAKRQIWLIRPDGGEAAPLTSAPGSVAVLRVVRGRQDDRLPGARAEERGAQEARQGEGRRLDAVRQLRLEPAVGDRRRVEEGAPAHERRRARERAQPLARRQERRLRGAADAAHPRQFPLRHLRGAGGRRRSDEARGAERPRLGPGVVAGRQVDRVRLGGGARRGLVHEQLRLRGGRRGRYAAQPDDGARRGGRRHRRLEPALDPRQFGRPVPGRVADERPHLSRHARRAAAGAHERLVGRRASLDRREGRDARIPARGLGHAARGVGTRARRSARSEGSAFIRRQPGRAATERHEPTGARPPVVPEGARELEGRRRPRHGGTARLPDGLREGQARAARDERPRRAGGNAPGELHVRDAALGLAALRASGLRGLLPEPARQRRLRRGLPLGEPARLGRQGLRGPDEGRGRARRAGHRRPAAASRSAAGPTAAS